MLGILLSRATDNYLDFSRAPAKPFYSIESIAGSA
jgi:hypothetical protein